MATGGFSTVEKVIYPDGPRAQKWYDKPPYTWLTTITFFNRVAYALDLRDQFSDLNDVLVPVLGYDLTCENKWVEMPWIEGKPLQWEETYRSSYFNPKLAPVTHKETVASLEALQLLHARGLAHGDYKPDNVHIITEKTGQGAEVIRATLLDVETLTREGDGKKFEWGTWQYSAPEREKGKVPTRPGDIWSVGSHIYRTFGLRHSKLSTQYIRPDKRTLAESIENSATLGSADQIDCQRRLLEFAVLALERDPTARPTASQALDLLQRGSNLGEL